LGIYGTSSKLNFSDYLKRKTDSLKHMPQAKAPTGDQSAIERFFLNL
jgi:hypothetical protein